MAQGMAVMTRQIAEACKVMKAVVNEGISVVNGWTTGFAQAEKNTQQAIATVKIEGTPQAMGMFEKAKLFAAPLMTLAQVRIWQC